jgi:hypothetical protein
MLGVRRPRVKRNNIALRCSITAARYRRRPDFGGEGRAVTENPGGVASTGVFACVLHLSGQARQSSSMIRRDAVKRRRCRLQRRPSLSLARVYISETKISVLAFDSETEPLSDLNDPEAPKHSAPVLSVPLISAEWSWPVTVSRW